MPHPQPNYVSSAELARSLGISVVAVFKRIKAGRIKAVKIGRSYAIPRSYLQEESADYPRHPLLEEGEFVSIMEAAAILGVTRQTVYADVRSGKLTGKRVGRHYVIAREQLALTGRTPQAHPALERDHVSVMELAESMGRSRKTIHYQIATGRIKAQRVGRHYVIAREDIPAAGIAKEKAASKPEDYVSVIQAASLLGISRIAVFKRIRKGRLKAVKIGRSYAIERKELGTQRHE